MSTATLLRIGAGTHGLGVGAIALAALIWSACFAIWLGSHARMLLAPSWPRTE